MKPLFAIRHIPTNRYLPEPTGKMGRGGSYTEPVDCSGEHPNPRLFPTRLAAQRALTAWLKGKWEPEYDIEYDEFSGKSYQYTVGATPVAVPTRQKHEMEIVEFHLQANTPQS